MEQRRLRLGDILDDYCPRERRVTNHAVVAMVEEKVQQTRCTTCDAEHVYKGAKEPRKRSRKDSPEGLFREVLAGMPDAETPHAPGPVIAAAAAARDDERSVDERAAEAIPVVAHVSTPKPPIEEVLQSTAIEEPVAPVAQEEERGAGDDGPFHRRLIRAQLPKIEGQKEIRQEPDFTIRRDGTGPRGGSAFRGRGGQEGNGGGNRPYGRRFAGGGNSGMPGGRGPSNGRGSSNGRGGPSAGPGRGGRPGFGGPSNGQGRGPSNGPPRGGPRKRSR